MAVTAVLALVVLIVFFAWVYLDGSEKLDEAERGLDHMDQEWLDRWHRNEHR